MYWLTNFLNYSESPELLYQINLLMNKLQDKMNHKQIILTIDKFKYTTFEAISIV